VLAVGKNELQTTNSIHGFRTKPRTGSSSAPVTNCKTKPKEIPSLIDTSFHQPLPNMVQRLFADVISDAIWFMNIHEQNHQYLPDS
jgi:hypothetical protein